MRSATQNILLRKAIRGILREAAGSGKIAELIGRIQEINSQIAEYYRRLAEEEGEDLSGIEIPRFGVQVEIESGSARVQFAIAGYSASSGELEPGAISRSSRKSESEALTSYVTGGAEIPWGKIALGQNDYNPCLDAWSIEQTSPTTNGWGPLLYDIAIEVATQEAGGLMSDRNEVSDAARAVWDKYDTARGDVKKRQLDLSDDDIDNWEAEDEGQEPLERLTPDDEEDDCTQWSAIQDRMGATDWYKSPLSRVYRKPPTTMGALRAIGALFEVDDYE
jgi:hypothetical protein